jgi:hypothetical protein
MGKAYTKDEVIGAALLRFKPLGEEYAKKLLPMYQAFYDEKGKDIFRTYASVTPAVMKEYFESKKC